jgi:hypothetical protein
VAEPFQHALRDVWHLPVNDKDGSTDPTRFSHTFKLDEDRR